MTKEEFINELLKLNINITQEQLDKLEIYYNYLVEYNEHTNLTAITDKEQIYLKHFYDSLTLNQVIDLTKNYKIIDVGTGAGFPGMVLKIVFNNLDLTLLDSNNKKTKFLESLCQKLNISDISIYNERIEDFTKRQREQFDIVTARAVSNMTELSELCLPLVKKDGFFIAMKGANEEEIHDALEAIDILGGRIVETKKLILPKEESIRNIVKVEKIKLTPKEYPRRYDKIKKYPLKNKQK